MVCILENGATRTSTARVPVNVFYEPVTKNEEIQSPHFFLFSFLFQMKNIFVGIGNLSLFKDHEMGTIFYRTYKPVGSEPSVF